MVWFPWNGSKSWLIPSLREIIHRWPGKGRYIEPFVGSGAISRIVRAEFPDVPQLLGDANPWLMSAYEWQASGLPYRLPDNWADVDYWRSLTDADLPNLSVMQRATRFAVCLHTAWGQRWETCKDGTFRSTVNDLWLDPHYLKPRLEGFFGQCWLRPYDRVTTGAWTTTVEQARPGDLVYLDPPYPETLGYGNQFWTIGNLLDLVDWAAAHKDVSLIMSNVADIKRLFDREGFDCITMDGPTASKTRRTRRELIAHNLGADPLAEFFCT